MSFAAALRDYLLTEVGPDDLADIGPHDNYASYVTPPNVVVYVKGRVAVELRPRGVWVGFIPSIAADGIRYMDISLFRGIELNHPDSLDLLKFTVTSFSTVSSHKDIRNLPAFKAKAIL